MRRILFVLMLILSILRVSAQDRYVFTAYEVRRDSTVNEVWKNGNVIEIYEQSIVIDTKSDKVHNLGPGHYQYDIVDYGYTDTLQFDNGDKYVNLNFTLIDDEGRVLSLVFNEFLKTGIHTLSFIYAGSHYGSATVFNVKHGVE